MLVGVVLQCRSDESVMRAVMIPQMEEKGKSGSIGTRKKDIFMILLAI